MRVVVSLNRRGQPGRPTWLRLLVASLLVFVAVSAASVIGAPAAGACSCAAVSDPEALEVADAVFVGTLVDTGETGSPQPGFGGSGTDPQRFVFDVSEVFKGEVAATQRVLSPPDGGACGLELSGPGPHLVFAFVNPRMTGRGEAGDLHSHLCAGSRPVERGALSVDVEGSPPATADNSSNAASEAAAGTAARGVDADRGGSTWPAAGAVVLLVLVTGAALWWGRRRLARA